MKRDIIGPMSALSTNRANTYVGTQTFNNMIRINAIEFMVGDAKPTTRNDGTALVAGDLWWETDALLLWYWNGTYWLSTELFQYGTSFVNISSTSDTYFGIEPLQAAQHDIYFVDVTGSFYIDTTNDGSKYWTATVNRLSASNTPTAIGSCNTSAISPSAWTVVKAALNTHVDLSGVDAKATQISIAKTSTPGGAYGRVDFTYRLAHT